MSSTKAQLRARVLAARDALTPHARAAASLQLDARVQALPEWQAACTVLLYLGIRTEYDPRRLAEQVLASGRQLVLPRILRQSHTLEIRAVSDLQLDLQPGVWGLQEPDPARCALVAPAALDLVLVPGVAYDLSGGRIGYGAGYYDRLLADPALQAPRISALFREQLVSAVPREPHDLPVDVLVLPDGMLRVPGRFKGGFSCPD